MKKIDLIPSALADLKKGKSIIVVDDPNRENQGDLIAAAELATAETINFMITEGRGMVCAPITRSRARALELPLMVDPAMNTEQTCINFSVTVDAKKVSDYGISAADRAMTVRALASGRTKPTDLAKPGHIFPLIARPGGVLERRGHTEATIDLMKLAGLQPAGVLCEILSNNGQPARLPELLKFAQQHNLKIVTIKDLVNYLKKKPLKPEADTTVTREARAALPTKHGSWQIYAYSSIIDKREHIALVYGTIKKESTLVRVHSLCLTGDTFGSLRCDCQDQLLASMAAIKKNGSGVIVYLDQEGRGIGLVNKVKAYVLQDKGLDTVEANHALGFKDDERGYDVAAEILRDLGINSVHLLTNNPRKIKALTDAGIRVTKRVSLEIKPSETNRGYLATKKAKLGHRLS